MQFYEPYELRSGDSIHMLLQRCNTLGCIHIWNLVACGVFLRALNSDIQLSGELFIASRWLNHKCLERSFPYRTGYEPKVFNFRLTFSIYVVDALPLYMNIEVKCLPTCFTHYYTNIFLGLHKENT